MSIKQSFCNLDYRKSNEELISDIRKIKNNVGYGNLKFYKLYNKISGNKIDSLKELSDGELLSFHKNITNLYFKYKVIYTIANTRDEFDFSSLNDFERILMAENNITDNEIKLMIDNNKKDVVKCLFNLKKEEA